jgi:decaprenyl-phosphate phosphoribosyltransferase
MGMSPTSSAARNARPAPAARPASGYGAWAPDPARQQAGGRPRDPAPVRRLHRAPAGRRAWLRAIRVRQWTKNLLVFAAPAAADTLGHPDVFARALLAFVVFCLLSSGVYLLNDARDAEDDRSHPVKRHRPVASGAISVRAATTAGAGAVLLGIGLALLVSPGLAAVAAGYAALNIAYTTSLREVAVADIASIAGSFVLRAVAGGIACGTGVSRWFILVVSFAALFVAAGKRYADLLDPAARRSRRVLDEYSQEFLRLVIAVACAVALAAYSLWAFDSGRTDIVLCRELTLVPFTLAILRYGLIVTAGRGGAPEATIFSDRFMQLAGAAWALLFLLGA